MNAAHFVLCGDPETLNGGYLYDKRIVEGLRAQGWRLPCHVLPDGFPWPDAAALAAAESLLHSLADGARVVIDNQVFGALPELLRAQAARLRLVALVHHPLAAETGLSAAAQAQLLVSEQAALAAAARVIVTSPVTARTLVNEYAVPAGRIGVVLPGTEPAPLAAGSGGDELLLLCVASLTPRKGHAVLLRALAGLRQYRWHLRCIGSLTRDAGTVAQLRALVAELGLEGRVTFAGEKQPDALEPDYHRADLFVLPSYLEGYGMVLAEALARGLPIVSTTGGAIPDTVPADAGLLVPPGDVAALAAALDTLFSDAGQRQRLAAGARRVRATLIDWPATCARFAAELHQIGVD